MALAARLADGFIAQRDEFVVERTRRDLPEALPTHFHVAFLGEAFAGSFGFGQHFCERDGIKMTLIQCDAAFLNDTRDDSRFRCARTDGANAIAAALGDLVNLGTHLRCGEKGVFTAVHWRAGRKAGLSLKREGMPVATQR